MSWPHMMHLLLGLGVILSTVDMTACQKTSFNKMPVCPANSSLAQLTKIEGARDIRSCFVACAASANCSVLHRTNGVCYFGVRNQLAELFNQSVPQSSDRCESYFRVFDVTSKLLVFFDFRQGFSNIASPGTYDATPHGSVTRTAQGAHFPGTSSDYIEVDTQIGSLISSYLDHPHNFSFFAKVTRQTYYQQSYHYFYDCVSTSKAGRFGDRGGKAWIEHQFLSQSVWNEKIETRESSAALFLTDNTVQAASLGAAFTGKTLNSLYMNGSNVAYGSDLGNSLDNLPRCLRLGFDGENDKLLRGRMVCYAIAKDVLNVTEFQLLDQLCS